MAAFLKRAFSYTASDTDYFTDDDGNLFEADIQAIRAAGVTLGCNPPANDQYCPNAPVKRDQMASFLARALGLTPLTPFPVITFGPGTHLVTEEIWEGRYAANVSSGGGFGPTTQLNDGSLLTSITWRDAEKKTHIEVVRWKLPLHKANP